MAIYRQSLCWTSERFIEQHGKAHSSPPKLFVNHADSRGEGLSPLSATRLAYLGSADHHAMRGAMSHPVAFLIG